MRLENSLQHLKCTQKELSKYLEEHPSDEEVDAALQENQQVMFVRDSLSASLCYST